MSSYSLEGVTPKLQQQPATVPLPSPGRQRSPHAPLPTILALLLSVALVFGTGAPIYVGFRNFGYDIFREYEYHSLTRATGEMVVRTSADFELRMDQSDARWAPLVLATAADAADSLGSDLGIDVKQVREHQGGRKILLVMYPSRESLRDSFGWSAVENALGAYWAGSIRLLSPSSWLAGFPADRISDAFKKDGPMVHELAHLLLDYVAKGNYPRWFTEGVAQYEEHEVTGFLWIEGDGRLVLNERYTLDQLEDFDSLDDQALAYRQSLLMVAFLKDRAGAGGLKSLASDLGRQRSFWEAVRKDTGLSRQDFEAPFAAWLPKNIGRWSH